MKKLGIIGSYLLLLGLGVFLGSEFFPKVVEAPESEPPPRTRKIKKTLSITLPDSPTLPKGTVSDTAQLLGLFVKGDAFTTSTNLRAALAEADLATLESHLDSLEDYKKEPAFHTARTSVLNHLIAQDPLYAFHLITAHKDPQFQRTSIGRIIQAIARLDPEAAQEAIANIDDPALQKTAQSSLGSLDIDSSPEFLLSLLEKGNSSNGYSHDPFGYSWSLNSGSFINYDSGFSHYGWNNNYYVPSSHNSSPLSKLAHKDLASAEAYARGLEHTHQRTSAMSTIAGALAQKDPNAALEWAKALDPSEGRENHIATVLRTMSVEDPQGVSSMLGEITNLQQRSSLINSISSHWIQKDPNAALSWIKTLPGSQAKTQALSSAFRQLIHQDSDQVPQLLEQIPPANRNQIVSGMIQQWANKDFHSAKQWLTTQDNPHILERGLSNLLSIWAQKAPGEAAAFLQNSSVKNHDNHHSTLARVWATKDPDAALQWAQNLEEPGSRQAATNQVYQQIASSDPDRAISLLPGINDESNHNSLLGSIASNLAVQNFDRSKEWISTLPQEQRFQAASSMLSSISRSQPNDAAVLLDQLSAEASGDSDLLGKVNGYANDIANSWGQHDPESAARWAQQITDEDTQFKAVSGVARSWVNNDAEGAADWINELPPGKSRDEATGILVNHVEGIDPESAFEWAQTITDDDGRYQSLNGVFNEWHQQNPEAAMEAIDAANITANQREHFLAKFQ